MFKKRMGNAYVQRDLYLFAHKFIENKYEGTPCNYERI